MQELKIEYLTLDKLKPYDKNARKHQEADLSTIKASITEFGMSDPIGVWGKDNTIVEGHGRYLACKELGIEKVPVIHLDHLTDEQRRAYALAHNKTAEMSEWDIDLLGEELDGIFDIDMSDFGFDLTEEEEETEIIEDEVPEEVEPVAKQGDIWQLGRHRLMCGDSTSVTDVEKLINGNKIELVLTDPPYNMGYSGAGIIKETTKNVRERIKDIIDFDAHSISYLASMDVGSVYIFTSKDLIPEYFKIFDGWKFNILTWVKTNNPPMCNNNFLPDIEYMLYFHKGKGRVWNNGLRPLDIYRKAYFSSRQEGHEEAGDVHPTMKPLKLLTDKIQISSSKNGNVLDIFGGSGSTLIACEQLNRNCFMMELDPHYVDVIIEGGNSLQDRRRCC